MNVVNHFSNLWSLDTSRYVNSISVDDNAFAAFLEVPLKDDIDIPTIAIPYVKGAMENECDSILMNISSGLGKRQERCFVQKTITAILSKFEAASYYETLRMAKVKTMKGVCYHGTKGLILDGDYNPLAMSTFHMHIGDQGRINYDNPRFYVSYRVFDNSSELLEHTIIKQVIPMYHTNSVYTSNTSSFSLVDVVIDDLDYMVTKPVLRPASLLTQEKVNKVIYDNI